MSRAILLFALLLPGSLLAASPANRLSWKVSEGKGIFGYIIYRAEQRQGPYLRASERIVRSANPGVAKDAPIEYLFVDDAVEAGKTYFYFIDVVDVSGRKQRLSGVQKRTVAPD